MTATDDRPCPVLTVACVAAPQPRFTLDVGKCLRAFSCAGDSARLLTGGSKGQDPPHVLYLPGLMFWFTRKKFVGSYLFLILASRE
jgi:hypothetical protein